MFASNENICILVKHYILVITSPSFFLDVRRLYLMHKICFHLCLQNINLTQENFDFTKKMLLDYLLMMNFTVCLKLFENSI